MFNAYIVAVSNRISTIENILTVDERRSKSVRDRVFDCTLVLAITGNMKSKTLSDVTSLIGSHFATFQDIINKVAGPIVLADLGCGNCEKTRIFIDAILEKQDKLHFIPVDISQGKGAAS